MPLLLYIPEGKRTDILLKCEVLPLYPIEIRQLVSYSYF